MRVFFLVNVLILCGLLVNVAGGQQIFGPLPYLQASDVPEGFCEECELEDFEDNEVDVFLEFDCGEILGPNVSDPRIPGVQITDSVDGDDGLVDGNGNGGHSYFCVDPAKSVTVTFAEPVVAAGVAWTDGDRGVAIQLEAFDLKGQSVALSEPEVVADDSYFGETAEDRFVGARVESGIASMTISTIGNGAGIEIDHVRWDPTTPVVDPDPPTVDSLCRAVAMMSQLTQFDINGDGQVSYEDVTLRLSQVGSLAGDANFNGTVSFDDFLLLSSSFGQFDVGANVTYPNGDFDCDGTVGFGDFLLQSNNFGLSAEAHTATVPEPSSPATMLGLVALLVLRGRRKQSTRVAQRGVAGSARLRA